jgi:hypothetical protein
VLHCLTPPLRTSTIICLLTRIVWMVWVLSSVVLVLASVVSATRAQETLCLHKFLSQICPEFEIVLV